MKYFRPSPVPPLHDTGDGADSYRHQSNYRPDNSGITSGAQSNAGACPLAELYQWLNQHTQGCHARVVSPCCQYLLIVAVNSRFRIMIFGLILQSGEHQRYGIPPVCQI